MSLVSGLPENCKNGTYQFDHHGSCGDWGNSVHPTRKGEIKEEWKIYSGLDLRRNDSSNRTRDLHETGVESADFIEAFPSLKS